MRYEIPIIEIMYFEEDVWTNDFIDKSSGAVDFIGPNEARNAF